MYTCPRRATRNPKLGMKLVGPMNKVHQEKCDQSETDAWVSSTTSAFDLANEYSQNFGFCNIAVLGSYSEPCLRPLDEKCSKLDTKIMPTTE
jgi:hypothetical protein